MRRILFATGVVAFAAALAAPALVARQDAAALDAAMKRNGPAFGALRKAIEASNAAAVQENAAVMKQVFAETEAFFKTAGKADAQGWAVEARKTAEAIEAAAKAGNWDDVKASAGAVGKFCQGCHTAYREKDAEGNYRYKG
ncbi:MAG: hypothetical protein AB1635_18990 [Acidobacteriota bacterium]